MATANHCLAEIYGSGEQFPQFVYVEIEQFLHVIFVHTNCVLKFASDQDLYDFLFLFILFWNVAIFICI